MTTKCVICNNKKDMHPYFCRNHLRAYNNIIMSYEKWIKAYGQLDEKNYLNRIYTNPYTGEWAKEVALYLIKNGGRLHVQKGR
jgi:hypothetical protein